MSRPYLKLISHKLCPYVQRARIVLAEKQIQHEIEFIDLANKPEWFRALSPLGKVPLLLVDGKPLFESAVIAEYLDEITPGSLHPADPFRKALHRSWIEFASSTLDTIAGLYNARDEQIFEQRVATLQERFHRLDSMLEHGPYFAGRQFSLVDAAFGPVFRYFDVIERFRDFGFFDYALRVQKWREALRARPSVQNAVVSDYPERLERFFLERNSILAGVLMAA